MDDFATHFIGTLQITGDNDLFTHKNLYSQKLNTRNEFDKAIREAEAQYMKVLEHSQVLLKMMKQGQTELTKLKDATMLPTKSSE